jgi:hypothetical protein
MWKKLGLIYKPLENNDKLITHASNPLVLELGHSLFRVFYNGRDSENKSSISFFDFDMDTFKVSNDQGKIVESFGEAKSYDSHGISNGCFLEKNDELFILTMAWQIEDNSHWRGDIGAIKLNATLDEGRANKAPFLASDTKIDLVSLSYPWVLKEDGIYKMWYGSTIDWTSENGEMIHVINYAESQDAKNWDRKGLAIPYEIGKAQAFSRPTVLKVGSIYHMWYSYRSGDGTKYKIGYASSPDGKDWTREDEKSGITASDEGWDSEMICYPCVFEYQGAYFMMYNGNNHGRSGIGLAKLIKL